MSKKEETTNQQPTVGLVDILKKYENSPSPEQIEQWKTRYGDVYVSGFSETELYVWRSLTRPEWVQLQVVASDPEQKVDQFKFEELICQTCVLWRSVDVPWEQGKAGIPQTLHEQILQNSCFMSPQAASMLVAKL